MAALGVQNFRRDKNAHNAYGRCIPYSKSPLLVKRWTGKGWDEVESGDTNTKRAKKALARGGERWVFAYPFPKNIIISGTPVSGRF